MANLADLQTERERLHAAEAKTAFEAALAETCDAKDMLAAGQAVRRLILGALDAAAVDFVSAIAGERDETRVHYLLSEAAHQLATGLGERVAQATPTLPELGDRFRRGVKPRDLITVSEWADRHRELRSGTNAPGPWHTDLTPYLREIMDALSEHSSVRQVTFIKSSGVGGTEAMFNWIGYLMHHLGNKDLLCVMPTLELRDRSFNPRLSKMIDESAVLAGLVSNSTRNKANRGDLLEYGARSRIIKAGANSPDSLRSDHLPYVICDEVDAFPWDVGGEGDPMTLIENRQRTFTRAKTYLVSTPTKEGQSRITQQYSRSDMRRYWVPCPHCGDFQPLEFGGKDAPYGLKWRYSPPAYVSEDDKKIAAEPFLCEPDVQEHEIAEGVKVTSEEVIKIMDEFKKWRAFEDAKDRHKAAKMAVLKSEEKHVSSAWYVCRECAAIIEEHSKTDMLAHGRWIADRPHIKHHRGYHINALYAPVGLGLSWVKVAQKWLDCQGDSAELKAFWNTYLGEVFSENGDNIDNISLITRLEAYPDKLPVVFRSAGVDVQKDRLEITVVDWGHGEEGWLHDHIILPGDTAQPAVWEELHDTLLDVGVRCAAVDSGYNATQVYAFVQNRRWCFATKGVTGMARPLVEDDKKRKQRLRVKRKRGVPIEPVGVDGGKGLLYSRLKMTAPGPGYIHFPQEPAFDDEYFAQLAAEKLVTRFKGHRPHSEWVQTRPRNEALDCLLLALVAVRLSGVDLKAPVVAVNQETKLKKPALPKRRVVSTAQPRY